jgi:nucleoid-associated protein YgaU
MHARLGVAVLLDVGCLVTVRPHPERLRAAAARVAVEPDHALAEIAGTVVFAAAAWAALAIGLVLLGTGPGRCGALARQAQRVVLPAIARRVLVGAVGVGLVVTPAVASAAPNSGASGSVRALPAPAWPGTADAGPSEAGASAPAPAGPRPASGTTPPAKSPAWPTASPPGSPSTQPSPQPSTQPSTQAFPTPRHTPPHSRPPAPASTPAPRRPASAAAVTVRPGDSLWAIARRRLTAEAGTPSPARVATAWPAWWTANRSVIGSDPDLIRPGQVLHAPTGAHSPAPTGTTLGGTA